MERATFGLAAGVRNPQELEAGEPEAPTLFCHPAVAPPLGEKKGENGDGVRSPRQQAVESSNTVHRPNTLRRSSQTTKMTSTALPPANADGSAPAAAAYHLYLDPATGVRPADCKGRRPEGLQDRRWSTFVYGAAQCRNKPVSGYALCETCLKRCQDYEAGVHIKSADLVWHGRVDDTDGSSLPAVSHIAGSHWFNSHVADGKLRWLGAEKPKTARQERGGGAARRVLINDTTLEHFATGRLELDIEGLSQRGEITGQQLANVLTVLTASPIPVKPKGTKEQMCARIRALQRSEGATATATVKAKKAVAPALSVSEAEGSGSDAETVAVSVASGGGSVKKAKAKGPSKAALRAELAAVKAEMEDLKGARDLAEEETAELTAALADIRVRARDAIASAVAAAEKAAEARIAALTAELAAAKERVSALSVFS